MPREKKNSKKVRYAVVGLGYIAQAAALPAFRHAKDNSSLVGLVSDNPKKLKELGKKYKTKINCSYEDYDWLLQSGEIDAVYIALPNHMHREYVEKAARAGIHILCEKPFAVTVEDCQSMINAAREANVKLMVAYRLHFDEGNLQVLKHVQKGKLGELKYFNSIFSMQVAPENIRTNEITLGGGTLYDIGIYCINAARTLFGTEPIEVHAMGTRSSDPRFSQIDESTAAILRFPEGKVASFITSFGSRDEASYKIVGTKGSLELESAYEWQTAMSSTLKIKDDKIRQRFSKHDQFAAEFDYFSNCILKGKDVEPGGEEGLLDVKIIEALYESARTHRPIRLAEDKSLEDARPTPNQVAQFPSFKEQDLVDAEPPTLQNV
jgi:predicted dehydrogenase